MADSSKTLKAILGIISADVKRIKKLSRTAQLPSEDALTLTRYASALDGIEKSAEKEKEALKKKLKNLDTKKLIEEYNKEKKQ